MEPRLGGNAGAAWVAIREPRLGRGIVTPSTVAISECRLGNGTLTAETEVGDTALTVGDEACATSRRPWCSDEIVVLVTGVGPTAADTMQALRASEVVGLLEVVNGPVPEEGGAACADEW
jgi:hypothetical protein